MNSLIDKMLKKKKDIAPPFNKKNRENVKKIKNNNSQLAFEKKNETSRVCDKSNSII